ncbi:hypothetical protein CVV68_21870 [Arthrobacter livingstonensis]|uniref:Uncharacterized protein n=1 Tax=Arthrobacter livingstonensis TaxID=670078 RepID=A0A2V5L0F9_9MICC|nr:hypothetical protein [Arthrobacter livingstonensis]PYI64468.1 hypothetical protein CVV68_21870 [Arthrobacter livingstonensis]
MSTPPSVTEEATCCHAGQNAAAFTVAMACFLDGLYAFSFVPENTAVALAGGLVLIAFSFFIPLQFIALFNRRTVRALQPPAGSLGATPVVALFELAKFGGLSGKIRKGWK